jgi:hypothetical protein
MIGTWHKGSFRWRSGVAYVAGVKATPVSIFYYFSTQPLFFFFSYFFLSLAQTRSTLLSLLFRLTLPPPPLSLSRSPFSPSRPLSQTFSFSHHFSHSGYRRPPSLTLFLTLVQGFQPPEKKAGLLSLPRSGEDSLSPCLPIRESTEPGTHAQVFF